MTEKSPRRTLAGPPDQFLAPGAPPPRVTAVLPEVRTDCAIILDEPNEHKLDLLTGARILWRVKLGWREAQKVQQWLAGAPADRSFPTREGAFRNFVETAVVTGDPPAPLLEFSGIFLSERMSHAQYTVQLGFRRSATWTEYQKAWWSAIDKLDPKDAWRGELVWFLQQTAGLATAEIELLLPASAVGDLRATGPDGSPRYPLIRVLLG